MFLKDMKLAYKPYFELKNLIEAEPDEADKAKTDRIVEYRLVGNFVLKSYIGS